MRPAPTFSKNVSLSENCLVNNTQDIRDPVFPRPATHGMMVGFIVPYKGFLEEGGIEAKLFMRFHSQHFSTKSSTCSGLFYRNKSHKVLKDQVKCCKAAKGWVTFHQQNTQTSTAKGFWEAPIFSGEPTAGFPGCFANN